jgi:hypothetical protein
MTRASIEVTENLHATFVVMRFIGRIKSRYSEQGGILLLCANRVFAGTGTDPIMIRFDKLRQVKTNHFWPLAILNKQFESTQI